MKNISEEIFKCTYKLIVERILRLVEIDDNHYSNWEKKIVDELAFEIINNTRVRISNAIYNAISTVSIDVAVAEMVKKLEIE